MLSFQMPQCGGDICSNKVICMYSKAHCISVESMTLLDMFSVSMMTVSQGFILFSGPHGHLYILSTTACIIFFKKVNFSLVWHKYLA